MCRAPVRSGVAWVHRVPPRSQQRHRPLPNRYRIFLMNACDGTTTRTDREWHEVELGVIATLGPFANPFPMMATHDGWSRGKAARPVCR